MPAYQGCLDGLCGPYAIANAFELCGLERQRQSLFEIACATAPKRRWPAVLWKGTTFGDLRRMIRSCANSSTNRKGVTVQFPFERYEAANNGAYWERFDREFEDPGAVCAIVGLNAPDRHWIVAVPEGRRMVFIDSSPERPLFRKNRSSLFAGYRRAYPTQWLLDRRAIAIFRA